MDEHQPTTEYVVKWSCANIDSREDSPITDWYMKFCWCYFIKDVAKRAGEVACLRMNHIKIFDVLAVFLIQ